ILNRPYNYQTKPKTVKQNILVNKNKTNEKENYNNQKRDNSSQNLQNQNSNHNFQNSSEKKRAGFVVEVEE
ncbi:MAG: hypothetical protein GYA60_06885, partial [Candidatus Methanofastidiosa archaeon]|nr:hypothetical protein [Candidatus Methanofastidiosa archaeon]